ncbi:MAG TPA: alpha-glucosidase C-terminal domain-containing protein [Candidatus Tectomicrobia bacterium]|nr:alpha-glucosidase C-terminal domain-containing protein [Candidatus Tectomicrobia bacterium]
MGIRQEDRFPILDVLAQTPPIPGACQWALFLRNHDELTLEMVTEEERRKIELMNGLLLSLPGTPVIYYGDEIGMGDNIFLGDRDGIRTPMQWSGDRNGGFSTAEPQRLYLPLIVDYEYHHQTIHVDAQQRNPSSLLSWMKRLIAVRKRYPTFGRGTLEFRHPANRSVLAFVRRWQHEAILVVANLSKFHQHVEVDLSGFEGVEPVELLSRSAFPPVGRAPYPLTLAPHGFLWMSLEATRARPRRPARLVVHDAWEQLVLGRERGPLEDVLPDYLRRPPWFTERRRRRRHGGADARVPHDEDPERDGRRRRRRDRGAEQLDRALRRHRRPRGVPQGRRRPAPRVRDRRLPDAPTVPARPRGPRRPRLPAAARRAGRPGDAAALPGARRRCTMCSGPPAATPSSRPSASRPWRSAPSTRACVA